MTKADDMLAEFHRLSGKAPEPPHGRDMKSGEQETERRTSGLGSFENRLMQALTFGGMDNLTSAIDAGIKAPFSDKSFGDIYNENQGTEQSIMQMGQKEHPVASGAGMILGSLLGPDLAGKLVKAPKTLMGMVGQGAASGAVNSAAQSFGEADDKGIIGRLSEAANGFMMGGVLGAGAGAVGGTIASRAKGKADLALQKALTTMRSETNAGYKAARETGEMVPGDLLLKNLNEAAMEIRTAPGYRSTLKENKGLEALMEDMEALVTSPTKNGAKPIDMDLATLDKIQQQSWTTYQNAKPGTKRQVLKVIKALDKTMDEAAEIGSPLLKVARNRSRMERNTKMFDDIMRTADRKGHAGTGDYASRYKYAAEKILDTEKYSKFLNEEETAALQAIIDGKATGNVARYLGRFAPTGGNLASLVGIMGLYSNPLIAGPALVGAAAAKGLSNKATREQVMDARRALSGSPTAELKANQVGPTLAKVAGQTMGPDMPSLMDALIPGANQSGAANMLQEMQRLQEMQQGGVQ